MTPLLPYFLVYLSGILAALQGAIRITTNGTDTRITHHQDL